MEATKPSAVGPFFLVPEDASRYVVLRAAMLVESPWSFGSSPGHDRAADERDVARFLSEDENDIAAYADAGGALVAAAGVVREKKPKFRHRANIWGVFVAPEFRRRGLARAVILEAIERAKSWQGVDWVGLAVSSNAPGAERLYRELGFEPWGREPEATDIDGARYDEIHMCLRL